MKVSVKAPIIYPVIVPTTSNLLSYNFYVVHYLGKNILIDAGVNTEECWQHFIDVLQKSNLTIQDIDAIILTHNHADHTGLVNRIRQIKNIPLYAHHEALIRLKRDPFFLTQRLAFFEKLYEEMGCGKVAENHLTRLKEAIEANKSQKIIGEILPLVAGDNIFGFQVIEVPGHAPDQIALFHEKSGIVFVGDHMIEHSSSNALVDLGKDEKRIPSLQLYEQSLQKLLHFPITVAYSGHGEVIRAPHELIRKKLARIDRKAERIKRLLDTPKTAAEIAKKMYKDRYTPLFSLIMSEIVGHLDRLEQMNEITKEQHRSVYYYVRHK